MKSKETEEITVEFPIFDNIDSVVIRWIVVLAMAANDLSYTAKQIKEAKDYAKIYLFRLGFAHLREIAKVVGRSRENTSIQTFILGLNTEAQQTYRRIEKFLGPYDSDSFVQKILKKPRDETFHYPDIDGELWPSLVEDVHALGKISIELYTNDRSIAGTRYKFIDVLLSQWINKNLSKDIVGQSSSIVVDLFSFVDYVFEYLVKRHNGDPNN